MKTEKMMSLVIALSVLFITLCAGVNVYADSIESVSYITLTGPSLTDLNYSSRTTDVTSAVDINHAGLDIRASV